LRHTTWNTPSLKASASFSSMDPPLGATTIDWATLTRMPSYRSSVPGNASLPRSLAPSSIAAGSATEVASSSTVGDTSSVMVSWFGADEDRYSSTVAVTRTRLPTAALAGGAPPVKTNTASEVAASPSSVGALQEEAVVEPDRGNDAFGHHALTVVRRAQRAALDLRDGQRERRCRWRRRRAAAVARRRCGGHEVGVVVVGVDTAVAVAQRGGGVAQGGRCPAPSKQFVALP